MKEMDARSSMLEGFPGDGDPDWKRKGSILGQREVQRRQNDVSADD